MTRIITARPLTREAFAPFGEVIETENSQHYPINNGNCDRYHALASAEAAGEDARIVLNILRSRPYALPLKLSMVERHPLGSQAFMPLSPNPFLVVVCADGPDGPGEPQAFITKPGQGVNYPRNRWHGVLMPIGEAQDFVVVDRDGRGSNLEEFHFNEPWEIRL
jgi:ureidoglycolate lyase